MSKFQLSLQGAYLEVMAYHTGVLDLAVYIELF